MTTIDNAGCGSIPGPSSRNSLETRTKARGAYRGPGGPASAGTFASGALGGAALLAAAAFLVAPGAARAGDDACGALSSNAASCSDQAYTTGILYNDASPITVTITGGAATTISATGNGGWWSAVVVRPGSHASEDRSIDLDVGATGNAVVISQGANTDANA